MGWLFGKKNDNVIDLTERYKKQQAAKVAQDTIEIEKPAETSQPTGFGIFGMSSTTTTSSTPSVESSDPDEKRRKLARRIMAMTDKIEDLSNQIYHLQQRIEVLEKKDGHRY